MVIRLSQSRDWFHLSLLLGHALTPCCGFVNRSNQLKRHVRNHYWLASLCTAPPLLHSRGSSLNLLAVPLVSFESDGTGAGIAGLKRSAATFCLRSLQACVSSVLDWSGLIPDMMYVVAGLLTGTNT